MRPTKKVKRDIWRNELLATEIQEARGKKKKKGTAPFSL
jgi:hypothetical protein